METQEETSERTGEASSDGADGGDEGWTMEQRALEGQGYAVGEAEGLRGEQGRVPALERVETEAKSAVEESERALQALTEWRKEHEELMRQMEERGKEALESAETAREEYPEHKEIRQAEESDRQTRLGGMMPCRSLTEDELPEQLKATSLRAGEVAKGALQNCERQGVATNVPHQPEQASDAEEEIGSDLARRLEAWTGEVDTLLVKLDRLNHLHSHE